MKGGPSLAELALRLAIRFQAEEFAYPVVKNSSLLDLSTPFTWVPSVPGGKMPCTGHPSLHVNVNHFSSFN